jgi:hypothetical protein
MQQELACQLRICGALALDEIVARIRERLAEALVKARQLKPEE